jgi:acyl-CoA synthetase (AMP-forming)/AMP-acid ligase II
MNKKFYSLVRDLVSMNEQGYFNFRGRLKDMVVRGGENIYPAEVENFLHGHPDIEDVYVVGVPDKRMGEELCACIKLCRGQTMTADELRAYCKEKISHFKIPKYVEIVDEFPMTVTGKIKKNVLAELIRNKLRL